jgi:DNA polymerase IV
VRTVTPGDEQAFLRPLPARALWGVGPATLARLERLGVRTVGDIADLSEPALVGALGTAAGRQLGRLARGVDPRPVEPDQRVKSIGHEETFPRDHHDRGALDREVVRMADGVAWRLRRAGTAARTVVLKVRFGDFRTITRSATAAEALDTGTGVARLARRLLASVDPSAGVRLVGVGVAQLEDGGVRQLSLDDAGAASWLDATSAVDLVRDRFGDDAIVPATLVGPDGTTVKRGGDQQWGPDDTGPDGERRT